MMSYFNESLSISANNNEISNRNPKLDSKNKISLRDLLKITLRELSDELESYNKKNRPISDVKEEITIDETKKFINSKNTTYDSIKLIIFNKEETDKEYIKYNISALRSIINKINRLIGKYYGKLIMEFIEPNKKGYITLTLTIKKTLLEDYDEFTMSQDKDLFPKVDIDDYLSKQMDYLRNEEAKLYEEFSNLPLEESGGVSDNLEHQYDLPSKRQNFVNGNKETKADDEVKGIRKLYKAVYGLSDEDFINGNFIPIMGKAFARLVGIIGIAFGGNRAANHKLKKKKIFENGKNAKLKKYVLLGITAFTALSAFVVNKALKSNMRKVQRDRLKTFYETKLSYLDEKIEKSDSEEEKYELKKLRNKLVRDSERVKIFANNAYKERS